MIPPETNLKENMNMKSVMIAAAALVAMTSFAAAAERPTILGYSEYAVEAETFELGAGAEFVVNDRLIVKTMVVGFGTDEDFQFDRLELNASYGINENVDLYGKLETDEDLNYSETTLGIALQF
jgi:hypothetical protein